MAGRYAKGHRAVGICERCSEKRLLRDLIYDGQYPDLRVCPDCWDPKHPQEYLPPTNDPVSIYDPTGDPDRAQASSLVISYPPYGAKPLELMIGLRLNTFAFVITGTGGASFSAESYDTVSFFDQSFNIG